MKSKYYVENLLPFNSLNEYASIKIEKSGNHIDVIRVNDFWIRVLGYNYLLDVNFSDLNHSFSRNPFEFLNASENMRDFYLRLYIVCDHYVENVEFLRDYLDEGTEQYDSRCLKLKKYIDDCENVFKKKIRKSFYIHLNINLFNEDDLFEVLNMGKKDIMSIFKGTNFICKNYLIYKTEDKKMRSIDISNLSDKVKDEIYENQDEFIEYVKNGKSFLPVEDTVVVNDEGDEDDEY